MAMRGTYEERLSSKGGGTFWVSTEGWGITYYFPGPDARYNGTWLRIKGADVRSYIEAYRANWEEYQALKSQVPSGGAFRKDGKRRMSINIGSSGIYVDGICIDGWHMPINSLSDLNALISSFEDCIDRSEKIMHWLRNG